MNVLRTELTEVVVHVKVAPTHPITFGHLAEDRMRRPVEVCVGRRHERDERLDLGHVRHRQVVAERGVGSSLQPTGGGLRVLGRRGSRVSFPGAVRRGRQLRHHVALERRGLGDLRVELPGRTKAQDRLVARLAFKELRDLLGGLGEIRSDDMPR